MRCRRANTSWVTSLTILAFCLAGIVANHFANRTLLPAQVSLSAMHGLQMDGRQLTLDATPAAHIGP